MLGRTPCRVLAAAATLALALLTTAAPARADQLTAELDAGTERGYSPVEELSYEAIIDASDGYHAQLRVRIALHNTSAVDRDVVLTLALPRTAELETVAVARDGTWSDGRATVVAGEVGRRDPGTIYVRQLSPEHRGDIPGAEVVGFSMESGATVQVELRMRIHPRIRGDRWELDLPGRGRNRPALATDRRVLVKGLRRGEEFTVDEQQSGDQSFMITRPEDLVTVAWPAHLRPLTSLDARYEVMPAGDGNGGQFSLHLNLGQSPAPRPDHLVVLIDRSKSTGARMQRETMRVLDSLFDALPATTTFDAIGFARHAEPLLEAKPHARPPTVGDAEARRQLSAVLDDNLRTQGTDLSAALALAARLTRRRGARKPLFVVITDGMLPQTVDPATVRDVFEQAYLTGNKRRRRPEVVFVVDDPLLTRTGLRAQHPVARVAAVLGARISYETLEQQRPEDVLELLRSPRVLGDLEVSLPDNMKLTTEMPPGLVAGTFLAVHGRYQGKAATSVRVFGKFGDRHVSRRARAKIRPPRADALVATPELPDPITFARAAREGFSLPPWYSRMDRRTAQLGITQAGRGGYEVKGQLSNSIFQYYLRTRVLPRARVCYNRAVQRNQIQAGKVMLEMEVGKGEVMLARARDARLGQPDSRLIECLTEAAWALDVPAGKLDDRVYRVRYPLTFTAPANGRPRTDGDPLGRGTVELLLRVAPRHTR